MNTVNDRKARAREVVVVEADNCESGINNWSRDIFRCLGLGSIPPPGRIYPGPDPVIITLSISVDYFAGEAKLRADC